MPPILVKNDPWLLPYEQEITGRIKRYEKRLRELEQKFGGIGEFASGHKYLGFNYNKKRRGGDTVNGPRWPIF